MHLHGTILLLCGYNLCRSCLPSVLPILSSHNCHHHEWHGEKDRINAKKNEHSRSHVSLMLVTLVQPTSRAKRNEEKKIVAAFSHYNGCAYVVCSSLPTFLLLRSPMTRIVLNKRKQRVTTRKINTLPYFFFSLHHERCSQLPVYLPMSVYIFISREMFINYLHSIENYPAAVATLIFFFFLYVEVVFSLARALPLFEWRIIRATRSLMKYLRS